MGTRSALHEELEGALWWMPLRTPTLPPATHTNCFVLGIAEGLVVVDPGSPDRGEQRRLAAALERLQAQDGRAVSRVLLTHHHGDHIGGVSAFEDVEVWAHELASDRVGVPVSRRLTGGERLGGFEVVYTPGHTRGHVSLWHPESRSLICGDLMAGVGTIVIDPPEGNMRQYLASLHEVRALRPEVIYPAHGEPIEAADQKLDAYIRHRLAREAAVLGALEAGGEAAVLEVVGRVYGASIPRAVWPLAARSALAHLEKLEEEGRVRRVGADRWAATSGA